MRGPRKWGFLFVPLECQAQRGSPKKTTCHGVRVSLRHGGRWTPTVMDRCPSMSLWPGKRRVWIKMNHQGTADVRPCFRLPGFHVGYLFLTLTQIFFGSPPKKVPGMKPAGVSAFAKTQKERGSGPYKKVHLNLLECICLVLPSFQPSRKWTDCPFGK